MASSMTPVMSYILLGALLVALSLAKISDTQAPISSPDEGNAPVDATGSLLDFVPKYFKILDGIQFEKLKSSSSVSAVYFYKRATNDQKQIHRFLQEYDKSAGFLNAYGLTLGLADCTRAKLTEVLRTACSEAEVPRIYTYRNGQSMLALDLETMFDVNSIMSNILQLALVDEVTIIQTKKNRQIMEHENAGQTDIIYSYHNAVGTYEHRVFMEIAYAYQDKYKFVVTTQLASIADLQDADTVNENSVSAMWILYCREKYNAATGCYSVIYLGEFSLLFMATYFKQLSWPLVMYQTAEAMETHPCQKSDEATCIYISHSTATKKKVDEVVEVIQYDLHGIAGLIVQHIDDEVSREAQDPQLSVRKGTGDYAVMEKEWNLNEVQFFLSAQMFPDAENNGDDYGPYDPESDTKADEVDDVLLHVATKLPKTITDDIPALTDKTFPTTIKGRKLVVVYFYVPFDAVGLLFLDPYQEAGRQLAALKGDDPQDHPLVRIDCYDWTDVCQKENITTYPVIHIYRDGGNRQQYRHALDKDVLVRTVRLLQAEQPLQLKTAEEVESFVAGHLPAEAHKAVDNFVLLRPSKSQKEVEAFKSVVKALETEMLFAIVGPGAQTNIVPKGGVLHVRLTDKHQAFETLTENLDADPIHKFLLKGQFHLLPELTHLNFPALYARKQPFGILFFHAAMNADSQLVVVNIVKSNKVPDLIFCKMSMDGINPIAETVLSNYTQKISLPSFAVVNHQKGEVFVLQDVVLTEDTLLSWLQDVQDGVQPPTKILEKGEWKPPGRHYDFLAIMDKEKNKQKKGGPGDSEPGSDCESGDCDRSGDNAAEALSRGEAEAQDSDVRSHLLELQRSRLYSGKDRKLPLHPPGGEQGDRKSVPHDEF